MSDLPADLVASLHEHGVDPAQIQLRERPGVPRPLQRWTGAGLLVEVATSDEGRRRNALEHRGREWAERQGIPVPEVVAAQESGTWLVSRHTEVVEPGGEHYVDAAIEIAGRIQRADPPPPAHASMASRWRAPRRTVVARQVRGLMLGVPTRLWLASRAAARRLPVEPVAHGDYYHRNILMDGHGRLRVIDWEFLGPAPVFSDVMRLWTVLPDRRDRDHLMEAVLESIPRGRWQDLGTQALWLSLRLLGENAKAPRAVRNPADLTHAREMLPEAREVSRRLGAWPL